MGFLFRVSGVGSARLVGLIGDVKMDIKTIAHAILLFMGSVSGRWRALGRCVELAAVDELPDATAGKVEAMRTALVAVRGVADPSDFVLA